MKKYIKNSSLKIANTRINTRFSAPRGGGGVLGNNRAQNANLSINLSEKSRLKNAKNINLYTPCQSKTKLQIKTNNKSIWLLSLLIAFLLFSTLALYCFIKPVQSQNNTIQTPNPTNNMFVASADSSTYTDTTNNIVYTYTPNYSLTIEGTTYTGIQINNINIPSTYTSTSFTIPNTITHNGTDYPVIDITSNLNSINVFYGSTGSYLQINSVITNEDLVQIGIYAFYRCTGINNFNFSASINLLCFRNSCFSRCTSLQSMIIPDTLKILYSSFGNCEDLSYLKISKSVKSISAQLSYGCKKLKEIIVDSENPYFVSINGCLYSIDENGNPNVLISVPPGNVYETFYVEEGTVEIGEYFATTVTITELYVPSSVIRVDSDSFNGLTTIEKITVSSSNTKYQSVNGVLYNIEQTKIVYFPSAKTSEYFKIGKNVSIVGEALSKSKYLKWVDVEQGNTNFKSINGVLFNFDGTILYFYPKLKQDEIYNIPYGVEILNSSAFSGCENLNHVVMPTTVTTIRQAAFSESSNLISVSILSNIVSLGSAVFRNCGNLEAISLPSTLTSIGDQAFRNCTSLISVHFLTSDISNVNLNGTGIFYNVSPDVKFYFCDLQENVSNWLNDIPLTNVTNATYVYSNEVFDIMLNANDGVSTTEVIQACNNQQFIFQVTEREGYIFTGWYTTSDCTTQVANLYGIMNVSVSNYTDSNGAWIGGEQTLYAGWIEVIDLTLNITNNLTNQLYDGYIIVQIGDYVSMISVPRNKSNVTLILKEVLAGDLKLSIKLYGDITVTSTDLVISDNQRYCFATVMQSSTISLILAN